MPEWDSELYRKQHRIASKLSDKGIVIALNQRKQMKDEAREAYLDVLRERGWSDASIRTISNPGINGNGWTPIHAIRFNEDGSVSLMGAHTNPAKLGTGARFKALTSELAAKGARTPGALAAWIGRKKYGPKKFASLSRRGRRRRS